MATYNWSVPEGKEILGSTKIKEADNKIKDTIDDLADFVNGEGVHSNQGLTYDLVDRLTAQTISGTKTFSNGIVGDVSGDLTGNVTGNADTATTLETGRDITLTGVVSGTINFDGSENATINTTYTEFPFPSGGIIMWSGLITAIPDGWLLCDGLNGTPNLVDRFIVGAGGAYIEGATGGSADAVNVEHTHTASTNTTGSHTHTINLGEGGGWSYPSGGVAQRSLNSTTQTTDASNSAGDHSHTVTVDSSGESGVNKNLPPYFALAYIMKG